MSIQVSVIIPAKDRVELLERAIKSVIRCDKQNIAEIIIVDDGSDQPIPKFSFMREWDKVVRLDINSGGAIARNKGIRLASGKLIYLLDSDDEFIDIDFIKDLKVAKMNNIYYTDVKVGNHLKIFPERITLDNFFDYILNSHCGIAQTSSLMFMKDSNIFFDESLPKHQDWDLILFSCLLNNINVIKKEGLIFIDWQDNNSISRKKAPEKSNKWLYKIEKSNIISENDYLYVELMCKESLSNKGHLFFFMKLFTFFLKNKVSLKKFLGINYRYIKSLLGW